MKCPYCDEDITHVNIEIHGRVSLRLPPGENLVLLSTGRYSNIQLVGDHFVSCFNCCRAIEVTCTIDNGILEVKPKEVSNG